MFCHSVKPPSSSVSGKPISAICLFCIFLSCCRTLTYVKQVLYFSLPCTVRSCSLQLFLCPLLHLPLVLLSRWHTATFCVQPTQSLVTWASHPVQSLQSCDHPSLRKVFGHVTAYRDSENTVICCNNPWLCGMEEEWAQSDITYWDLFYYVCLSSS